MHRIFVDKIPLEGVIFKPERREADHLFKVLRARHGEIIELLDGRGGRACGEVTKERNIFINKIIQHDEPKNKIHLLAALPRKNKLDDLLKQLSELGVWSFRPLKCERSVSEGNPRERWELLLREGCKQSGNPFIPQLLPELSLSDALDDLKQCGTTPFYGEMTAVLPPEKTQGNCAFLVGPEGGFTDNELALMRKNKVCPLNLGPHILRLETAAVAGVAVLRFLGLFLLVLALCGCENRELSIHPLMRKGAIYQREGNGELARKFYNRAARLFPDAPEPQLALGAVSDELLNDPAAALYHYREYLRLIPQKSQRCNEVESYCKLLRAKLKRELEEGDLPRLPADVQSENRELRQQVELLMRKVLDQRKEINQLKRRREK